MRGRDPIMETAIPIHTGTFTAAYHIITHKLIYTHTTVDVCVNKYISISLYLYLYISCSYMHRHKPHKG